MHQSEPRVHRNGAQAFCRARTITVSSTLKQGSHGVHYLVDKKAELEIGHLRQHEEIDKCMRQSEPPVQR